MGVPRLGINIDHVATVRNARGEDYPSPLKAALQSQKYGADSITIHLREDRRHIVDQDIIDLKKQNMLPLNLEMAVTDEMQKIALDVLPNAICLVPEKREELTTEGGLDIVSMSSDQFNQLSNSIHKIQNNKIKIYKIRIYSF